MQKYSELTTMKATGISLYRATLPIIVLSALFAGGLSLFDQFLPSTPTAGRKSCATKINASQPRPTASQPQWIVGDNNQISLSSSSMPTLIPFVESPFLVRSKEFSVDPKDSAAEGHWEPSLNKFVFENGWVRRSGRNLDPEPVSKWLPSTSCTRIPTTLKRKFGNPQKWITPS